MNWSEPQLLQQGKKKKLIPVETALLDEHPDRFALYQTNAGMIPSMWSLWDRATETQHFLNADGWEHARKVAEARIVKTLATVRTKKPRMTRRT